MSVNTDLQSTISGATPGSTNSNWLQELGTELAFTQDGAGNYLSFYWRSADSLGLNLVKVVGVKLSDTFSPTALGAYLAQIQQILSSKIPKRCHYTFNYQQQSFGFDLVISPILQPDGTAKTVLVMGSQSSQPEAEKPGELSGAELYQKLLTPIARNIRRSFDLDIIWQQVVMSLGKALNVSRCIICSYKPDRSKLQVEAEYCQMQFRPMLGQQLSIAEDAVWSKAIATLEPVTIERPTGYPFQQQSVLAIATSYQHQPNGLISLHQCDRYRPWTSAEIELVRELAEQLGTAIAHATFYQELEKAREQSEEASRMKSEFLAVSSHELRTPLNGIIGFLKLVLDGMADDEEEQQEFIEEAHRSALHLLNIINDILDIAKIEAGKMELDSAPVKLAELFQDVEDFTKTQAVQKQLSFTLELPHPREEVIVYGNYQRLLQIMLNLVGNAIKFTHEGGVTISAEVVKRKIMFKGQELPGIVKVQVADTGIGVSLDKQDKLFQAFTQVDGSLTRQYGGTGLGLTISQKLVETMGGAVNFYSMGEGLGSTVTFTVPLYQVPTVISSPPADTIDLLL